MPRKGVRTRKPQSRFTKLAAKLSKRPGIYSPRGLAASIGRKKYGSAGMAAMSAAGRSNPMVPWRMERIKPGKMADYAGQVCYGCVHGTPSGKPVEFVERELELDAAGNQTGVRTTYWCAVHVPTPGVRHNPRVGVHQRMIELENEARHGGRPLTPIEAHELRLAYDALKVPFLHRVDTNYDKRALAWELGRHRGVNPLPEGSKYAKRTPIRINERLEEVSKDEGRLVEICAASGNGKTGPVAATSACQLSCPESCPFFTPWNERTAGGHGKEGCYGELGNQAMAVTSKINKGGLAAGASPEDIAKAEAHGIQVMLERVLKGKKKPMRLHVVGDARTGGAARILSDVCQGWPDVWSYTHAWKSVDRGAWDGVSVLASCETPDEVKDAHSRGYATATVLPVGFKDKVKVFEWNGLQIQPCWAQSGHKANCMSCKLCWRAPNLLRQEHTIAFTVHGEKSGVAKQHVLDKLKSDGWDPNGGGRVK